jgi:hypothetical protein
MKISVPEILKALIFAHHAVVQATVAGHSLTFNPKYNWIEDKNRPFSKGVPWEDWSPSIRDFVEVWNNLDFHGVYGFTNKDD